MKVSSVQSGFHPWTRLVHRLGKIAPHRQVQLLCLISVVALAVIVGSVLAALRPTQASLRHSSGGLVVAIGRLNTAREQYVAASSAVQATVNVDLSVRNAAISQLTSLNTGGEAAWNEYIRISARLPGERKLQRVFVADRSSALEAGGAFITDPAPTAAGLAKIVRLSESLREDLNRIRDLYDRQVQRSLTEATDELAATQQRITLVSIAVLLLMLAAFGVAARSARAREDRLQVLDRALHEDAERNELEARLQRSLEMASTEVAVFNVVSRALGMSAPGVPSELLVADSSRAHFRQVATAEDNGDPGCPVSSPVDCPAATWGQTQVWTSSTALDACPYLQGRVGGDCSAMCVPLSIGGKTVGVVHATGEDEHPPPEPVIAKIELIAREVGERIGMLRAFRRSETQAQTDPLTGLMNRRSLEEKVRGLTEEGTTYVAAYGDLDHFKQLNDVHGHDAGDQALRLFARVLRDTVRPNDLTARYGGEEFVVVLPDCQVSDVFAVINRLRAALADAQTGAGLPKFTVSFGITPARPENTFSQTLEIADAALLKAKATGRDRIVISGTGALTRDAADATPTDRTPTTTTS